MGTSYAVGDLATFEGVTFRARQAHTSQVGWEPPNAPALWERPGPAGIVPWQNQTAYVVGSGVSYDGLVYRCIQAHTSQPDWTPPSAPTLWKVTGNVQIPPGVSGSLAFVFTNKNLPTGVSDGFGLVQRDPFGDPSYTELLDSSKRAVGEVFHRVQVQGGEVFELFLQANKTRATSSPSMSPATYSSDPTLNMGVDPTFPDHVAQPLQTPAQKASHIWSIRWESFKFGDPGRDGNFDDLGIELRLETPCNNVQVQCPDPNLVVSSHNATLVDYRGDFSAPVAAAVAGVPTGPVKDAAGGEGSVTPIGTSVSVGGRVDTLRWSFVQESTDFSAASPLNPTACPECNLPPAALLGGGLWNLQIMRIHRPRAEAWVSSFGPGVFSNFDAKLTIQPGGIGNQNTIVFFDPHSDAPPVTFFELSQQDGDSAVDGRYHDTGTRMYGRLELKNVSGTLEPNPLSATQAVITRRTGEQIKFEIINVQGTGATQRQGRVTEFRDRNGNATAVSYQFAASASDTQLGGDRKKLWLMNQVADPHGVSATFSYQLRAASSRWVVGSISLPDGTTTQYQYGASGGNLDRLTSVVHANGDTSEFSRSWDPATQSWALTLQDAMAGDGRTWKTVHLTGATYTTADNVVHNQEPNLVRRIVNSSGEQVYRAQEDPNDPNTTFFREGENRITRLTLDPRGTPREVAQATDIAADPLLASYAVVESYEGDVLGMIQKATDGFGNARSFERDSRTRAVTSVTARGGTQASYTLNGFLQPTRTVDRLGRITDVSYDSKGNPLSITHAVGTTVEAAWSYGYNTRGQVTSATDANGKSLDYGYDSAGFLTSITQPADVTGGSRPVRTFEYTSVGRLSAAIDASGRRVTFSYDGRGRLTTTTHPDQTMETLVYGSGGNAGLVVSRIDRNGIVEQHQYDYTRRLTSTTRAVGRPEEASSTFQYLEGTELPVVQTTAGERVEVTYDERQRPVARKVFVNGTASLISQTSWDTIGRPVSETDPYGRRFLRVFDVNGRVVRTVRELVPGGVPPGADLSTLARVTTPNPPYTIEEPAYDAMNQYVSTTNERGFVTTQSYDAQGRRTELKQAAGTADERKTTFEYDLAGNLIKETRPRTFSEGQSFETVYTYTGRNLVATVTEAAGTADAATTSYTYSPTGKQAAITDPRGGVTTLGYDACCDRVISQQDAAGFTTTFTYDGLGNRTTVTNPLAHTTTTTYDGHNRVASETNPLGETTTYTYDDDLTDGVGIDATHASLIATLGFGVNADGSAVQTTNPAGESTVSIRDGMGRSVMELRPSGEASRTTYDEVVGGLVQRTSVDPLGNSHKTLADMGGRARRTIDPTNQETVRSYDAAGNLSSERDPNGVGQDCTYDALNRRQTCTDTQGDTTSWQYDASGNVVSTTDGAGVARTCTFDFRDRQKTCRDGNNQPTTRAYDGNSNLTEVTDAEGGTTVYTYDARNLKTSTTYPDSTGPTDKVVMTYDDHGRLHTVTDQAGNQRTFAYDDADRLISKTSSEGTDSFTYDDAGRPAGASSTLYGTDVTRAYDAAGRLQSETTSLATPGHTRVVSYSYDAADRVATVTYPDGTVVTKNYDGRSLLSSIQMGSTTVVTYGRDAGGRTTTRTLGNGVVETVNYRADNQVASINNPTIGDLTYSYDAAKRKLGESGAATNGPQTFGYDSEGRVTSWSGGTDTQSWVLTPVGDWQSTTRNSVLENRTHNAAHEVTAVNGLPLTSDARGNIVVDEAFQSLTWDLENKLRSVRQSDGPEVSYAYDAFGRKLARADANAGTMYVYDGQEVIAEYREAFGGSTEVVKYILGEDIDKPVAYTAGSVVRYFSGNHVGSVVAVTDASGAVVERYRYSSHGERTVLSPAGAELPETTIGNYIGFTGREHDPLSGLIDFRFRQLNPRLGRFVSRDDEYREGMLLYGAYFVPNARDPSGHYSGPDSPNTPTILPIFPPSPGNPTPQGCRVDGSDSPITLCQSLSGSIGWGGVGGGAGIFIGLAGAIFRVLKFVGPSTSNQGRNGEPRQGGTQTMFGAGPSFGNNGPVPARFRGKMNTASGIAFDLTKNEAFLDVFRDTVGQLIGRTLPREIYASSLNMMAMHVAETSSDPRVREQVAADERAQRQDPNFRPPPVFTIGSNVFFRAFRLEAGPRQLAADIMHEAAHIAGAPGDELAEFVLERIHQAAGLPR